jgi:hypothetical protein
MIITREQWMQVQQEARDMMSEAFGELVSPEGCTCDPKPAAVETMPGHGTYELMFDPRCEAHQRMAKR